MTDAEALLLLRHRVAVLSSLLEARLPWYQNLEHRRQEALIDMAYQLVINGLLAFKKALAAMAAKDWNTAADELLDSKWARHDSPRRALEIAGLIRGAAK